MLIIMIDKGDIIIIICDNDVINSDQIVLN